MTFDGGHWTMTREDSDFHQRFIADVEKDRIFDSWQASEDAGKTWRRTTTSPSNAPQPRADRDCCVRLVRGCICRRAKTSLWTKSLDLIVVEALLSRPAKSARHAISATCANPGTSLRH
jgi:hypothetical protein